MEIKIENWINVLSGTLSIIAIIFTGISSIIQWKKSNREEWIKKFSQAEEFQDTSARKIELMKNYFDKYKETKKLKEIFIEACEQRAYTRRNAERHYEAIYLKTFPEKKGDNN